MFLVTVAVTAALAVLVTALLVNIVERKGEARNRYVRLVEVTEDDTDPAAWGVNWPRQYESYLRTAQATRTRFGGHGGSEALPEEKIERDPWLKRMFLGYAFSIDYRDRRGHAYMLVDQENTERQTVPQSGSCLHCHASLIPVYRELGDGDVMAGFEQTFSLSYQDLNQMLHDQGHAHPISCVDCHQPDTMQLRVTRPGFVNGIRALAESDSPVPQLPSIEQWRQGPRAEPYDPNVDASRTEMRSYVCGQCHVEYYCANKMPLTFPWGNGLKVEDLEQYWDELTFEDGNRFFDYTHRESGARILKAQHPEFELWSQGIHARSGVAC
ncbi:ammonia-forming cytochrome c nitrite reductase subunit c552, partial [Gemmatimonadota bacterium]